MPDAVPMIRPPSVYRTELMGQVCPVGGPRASVELPRPKIDRANQCLAIGEVRQPRMIANPSAKVLLNVTLPDHFPRFQVVDLDVAINVGGKALAVGRKQNPAITGLLAFQAIGYF